MTDRAASAEFMGSGTEEVFELVGMGSSVGEEGAGGEEEEEAVVEEDKRDEEDEDAEADEELVGALFADENVTLRGLERI